MKFNSSTKFLKLVVPAPLRRKLRALQQGIGFAWHRRFGRYYCPVCETRVNGFNPLPPFYREQWQLYGFDFGSFSAETLNEAHYSCPNCGASDRDRLYAMFLDERLRAVSQSFRLIDFAPAQTLRNFITRSYKINYRTADLFMDGVDDRVDLTDMHIYADGSVDAFICSHILEHIPDDRCALRELFRILKPGGWGILMVPISLGRQEIYEDSSKTNTEANRWRYFGQGDHVRIYSKQGFLSRVVNASFKVSQLGIEHFGNKRFERCGITRQSILYVVEK